MRATLISLAVLLVFPGTLSAGEKLYLSRTLDLNFRHPGRILKTGQAGTAPVSEKNSYVLVLPEKVTLKLSIANDNPGRDHYHIRIKIHDEKQPSRKVDERLKHDRLVQMFWLAQYRYQFTFIQKHVTGRGRFVSATVKLDVYAPEP